MTSQTQDLMGYRYVLHEPLGQGGMGIVYRATDRLNGQTVALKRVHFSSDESDTSAHHDAQLALANEFQTLSSLRHPYIISVLDYGFDSQKRPYFTMEFLESARPVTEYVKDKPLRDKVRLFSEMLQALAYLHRRGITHRDLKPDNAVVQLDGHFAPARFRVGRAAKSITGRCGGHAGVHGPGDFMGSLPLPSPIYTRRASSATKCLPVIIRF
ncbi:serine/threonine protein kinase [bacterium]|nr:serine/threonine protein kinase [bacterium]